MKIIFWFSLFFIMYVYAIYPLMIVFLSAVRNNRILKAPIIPEPTVSVVIAARNEGRYIRRRIQNLLEQNYPYDKMEIIIVSDGSSDNTEKEALKFTTEIKPGVASEITESTHVKVIRIDLGKGKAQALNTGIDQAIGQYIIFTDARQLFHRNAIRELIANFSDPTVGCVSGDLYLVHDSESTIANEMSFYWRVEKLIRKFESKIHSVPGATGAIYAIDRSLFSKLPTDIILDDVYVPMSIILNGKRCVFDINAIAYDIVSKNFHHEKRRKVRTLLGNYQLLKIMPELLSPHHNPIFWNFVSHKVFRLMVPFFFLALVVSSLLATGTVYSLSFVFTLAFLSCALIPASFSEMPILGRLGAFARAFIFLNYCALLAFFYFVSNKEKNVW